MMKNDEKILRDWLSKLPRPEPPPFLTGRILSQFRHPMPRRGWSRWMRHLFPRLLPAAALAFLALFFVWTFTRSETRVIEIQVFWPGAVSLKVAGDFNQWNPDRTELKPVEGTGLWKGNLHLSPGRFRYMIVVDDKLWIPDPGADELVDDGLGGKNSILDTLI